MFGKKKNNEKRKVSKPVKADVIVHRIFTPQSEEAKEHAEALRLNALALKQQRESIPRSRFIVAVRTKKESKKTKQKTKTI